jgi:hypothetical protein
MPPTSRATAQATPSAVPASEIPGATPGSSPGGSPDPASPGATIDPALAAQVEAVNAQIPPIRQLDVREDVPFEFVTREQFRAHLLESAFEHNPEEWRNARERFLKRLGLIPADADLDQLILDLYGAAIAAYYEPDTGSFYIIERNAPFGPTDKVTTAHEYTHALQDQHFDLEGNRIRELAEGDAILAQLAAIEGDATLTSQEWLIDNLSQAEQLQLLQDALEQLDEDILEGMPIILRRQLEFPYGEGFLFVRDIFGLGGFEAVNQAIQTPPASTEQILHSQKYFDQEAPVDVTVDDLASTLGAGWSLAFEQTMGELNMQVVVGGGEEPAVNIPGLPVEWPHAEAAAGWGGDRLHMYENGDLWLIDWQTTWDTEADAAEFEGRIIELMPTLRGHLVVDADPVTADVRVLLADSVETADLVLPPR